MTKISSGGVQLTGEGELDRVVTIKPLTANDQEIWTTVMDVRSFSGWELDLRQHGDPKKLDILVAVDMGTQAYPFSIRIH